jgi:protein-S-isoprenylcysteine O-methyltransferase Ste14
MNAAWLLTLPLLVGRAADPVPAAEDVRPGWIAVVTVVLLCAASVFLWFSMRKQLRRIQVPREDVKQSEQPEQSGSVGPAASDEDASRHGHHGS